MTNLLKVALEKDEKKLSEVIIAYYQCSLTEDIIVNAIKNNQFEFLHNLFGFGKNFLYNRTEKTSSELTFK